MNKLLITLLLAFSSMMCHATPLDSVFTIQGSKGKLVCRVQLPEHKAGKKLPIAILCHGLHGQQNDALIAEIAKNTLNEGIGVVRLDLNGHGKSDGDFVDMDATNIQQDMRCLINWTLKQPYTKNISLTGHSLGGIVVGMVAHEYNKYVKGLVLIASGGVAPDLMLMGNFFGIKFDPWNVPEYIELKNGKHLGHNYIVTMRDLPIYPTAKKYTGPALILNGTHDNVVPYTYAQHYADVMKNAELRLIEGDNHMFSVSFTQTALDIAHWLKSKQGK